MKLNALTQEVVERFLENYRQYLTQPMDYPIYRCDGCGWFWTHPLQYCPRCPGRIVQITPTRLHYTQLKMQLRQPYDTFEYGFRQWLKLDDECLEPDCVISNLLHSVILELAKNSN